MSSNPRRKLLKSYQEDYHIPEQVLEEILIHLSADDLQNYKSVSKSWSSFISQPHFTFNHANFIRSKCLQDEMILFTTITKPTLYNSNTVYRNYAVLNIHSKDAAMIKELQPLCCNTGDFMQPKTLCLLASCDGLLLIQDKYSPNQLYISNPLTRHSVPLPTLKLRFQCLAWALMPAADTNTYHVIGNSTPTSYVMLTFGKKSILTPDDWKLYSARDEDGDPTSFSFVSQHLVVENAVHWFTKEVRLNQSCYYVYSLNREKGIFTKTKFPSLTAKPCRGLHLLSMLKEGSLCLTVVSPHVLEMFVLEYGDYPIWTLSHTISLVSLSKRPSFFKDFLSGNLCLFTMRGVDRYKLSDLVKVLIHYKDQLVLFDLKTQEFGQIGFLSKDQILDRPYFHHSHSFLSCTWTSNSDNTVGISQDAEIS